MSFEQLAEDHEDFYAPGFEVRVGKPERGFGQPEERFDGSQGTVSGIRVTTQVGESNRFSFSLEDCFDRSAGSDGAFDEDLRSTFAEGQAIEIRAGYGETATEPLLWGRVDAVKPSFPAGGAPALSVSGFDLSQQLKQGTGTGKWSETDLGTVVKELVSDPSFADETVEPGDVSIDSLHHSEETDYEFLTTLAKRYDCEQFSQAGTYHFRAQSARGDRSPVASLQYGRALRSFTPGSDNPRQSEGTSGGAGTRVGTVKVRHNDEVQREVIEGTASVRGGGDKTRVENEQVRSEAEAEQRAEAIAGAIERTGDDSASPDAAAGADGGGDRGETIGLPEVQIGRVLELGGIGSSYSGQYYVESATHRIDDGGYTTSFSLRRLPEE